MRQAVSTIIFNDERTEILLIKRRDVPVWVLPGGGLEQGESPEEAALRETLEETGFRVAIKRKVAQYSPINRLSHFTHFFECRVLSGEPTIGIETKEIRYFPLNALPKRLAPPYSDWIQDAEANKPLVLEKKIESSSYWNLVRHLIKHPLLVCRFLLTKVGIHFNS
ncbi:MAG TPA: NUDIX domain-containing protein [Rhabdochlamydiaceae bacterium]|nr:NUDIX domain-containing protein [Rhabdochlamydiaceae bacterium]